MKNSRRILLLLAALLTAASSASAAFPTNFVWTAGTAPTSIELVWTNMGSHTTGYTTYDLVATVKATTEKPQNDWTYAEFKLTTNTGSILQVAPMVGSGAVAQQALWEALPTQAALQWETFAIGNPVDNNNNPLPWTSANQFGAPQTMTYLSQQVVCDTSTIDMGWADFGKNGPGTYHIFRLTVSDDWSGWYSGRVFDDAISGTEAGAFNLPEPVTMSVLALGAAGMLLRRRRCA